MHPIIITHPLSNLTDISLQRYHSRVHGAPRPLRYMGIRRLEHRLVFRHYISKKRW
jgi:hypothetical protein